MGKRVVLGVVVALVATIAAIVPASAAERVSLDVDGFFDIVLDEANGHLFVSEGLGATEVVVLDLAGAEVARIGGLDDATGLALSEDGAALWVALPTAHAVTRIDTSTLSETARYVLPTSVCPGSLVETAGYVAVGHSCNRYALSGGYGSVGVLDPATGVWNDLGTGPYYQPYVTSSPGSPGLVVAGDLGISPTTLYMIGIVDGIPDVVSSRWNTGSNLRDLAVAPDGSQVVQASGYPYQHDAFTLPDLGDGSSFPSTNYPNAVAWSADGSTVVTGTDSAYDLDVRVHAAGSTAVLAEYEFEPHQLLPRGLAVTSSGSVVYAVTGAVTHADFGLHVLTSLVPSTMEVPGTANATVGDPIDLTGRLSFADGVAAAGRSIEVRRTYADHDQLVGVAATDGSGAFAIVDSPTVATPITYTFSFAGDSGYTPSSGQTVVSVAKRAADLSISVTPGSGKGKRKIDPVVTAVLGPTSSNRVVTITALPEDGTADVIASGPVDASGELSVSYRIDITTTFVASFDGDEWYLPATAETTFTKKKRGKGKK